MIDYDTLEKMTPDQFDELAEMVVEEKHERTRIIGFAYLLYGYGYISLANFLQLPLNELLYNTEKVRTYLRLNPDREELLQLYLDRLNDQDFDAY